jgi:TonB family protein
MLPAALVAVLALSPAGPTAAPSPACSVPNASAAVLQQAPAYYPDSARFLNLGPAVVTVSVTVDANGRMRSASIVKSSANLALDQAALRAARNSTFSPKVVDCTTVEGIYFMRVEIDP